MMDITNRIKYGSTRISVSASDGEGRFTISTTTIGSDGKTHVRTLYCREISDVDVSRPMDFGFPEFHAPTTWEGEIKFLVDRIDTVVRDTGNE